MSSILTPEQKKNLAPVMGLIIAVLAVCGGYFVYHLAGGDPIPLLDTVAPYIMGVIAALIIWQQLRPK